MCPTTTVNRSRIFVANLVKEIAEFLDASGCLGGVGYPGSERECSCEECGIAQMSRDMPYALKLGDHSRSLTALLIL